MRFHLIGRILRPFHFSYVTHPLKNTILQNHKMAFFSLSAPFIGKRFDLIFVPFETAWGLPKLVALHHRAILYSVSRLQKSRNFNYFGYLEINGLLCAIFLCNMCFTTQWDGDDSQTVLKRTGYIFENEVGDLGF